MMNTINKSVQTLSPDSPWQHVASFKDLSVAYFPDVVAHNASKRLKQWILENDKLQAELRSYGWNEKKRLLTPLQVGCIIRYFGEP